MATAYPAALDNFSNPAAGDALTGHAQKHTDLNDAVEAIENFVGTSASPAVGTVSHRLDALEAAGGGSSVSTKQVTLDFGSIPTYSKSITFSDASITASSKILMVAHAESDELEMDGFVCSVQCGAGVATAYIHAVPGPVTGTRKFNYVIG